MALSLLSTEQTVLLSVDSYEQSEAAVNFYLERIHRPGNKLVFVHCIELPELHLNKAREIHMSPGVLADLWKEEGIKTKLLEERMKTILKSKGIAGVLKTITGSAGEGICRMAVEENAVMIIVGLRGMGKMRRKIVGSVSDYLIHHAYCPVIVCRLPGKLRSRQNSGSEVKVRSRHVSSSEIEKHRHVSGETPKKSHHAYVDPTSFRARLNNWGRSVSLTKERTRRLDSKDIEEKENQEKVPTAVITK